MTHAELVERAARWLRSSCKCPVVLTEASSQVCNEFPDAIGWTARGFSVLVECKASRADFLADKHKPSRRGGVGAGHRRFYLAPKGLITVADLTDGWGLLVAAGSRVRMVRDAESRAEYDHRTELALLGIELRRVTNGWRKPGDRVGVFLDGEVA